MPELTRIVCNVLTRVLTYPVRRVRCSALYNDVLYSAIRCMLDRVSIPQLRYLNPNTTARYLEHCHKSSIKPNSIEIETAHGNIPAHWIGNPHAKHIVYYCHGGGYTQSANHGNFTYLTRLVDDFNRDKSGSSLAVLMIAYTLAPDATHPTQLREASAGLNHLITNLKHSPANIIISGDSAGGNLAINLLSHLLHPHPEIAPIKLIQPLGGALIYSPWTGFSTTYASFNNEQLDMLSPIGLRKWSAMFLNKADPTNPEKDPGDVSGDSWSEPCQSSATWWQGLHTVVNDIFVAYGGNEVLAGPIQEFEKNLRQGWKKGGADENRVVFLEGRDEAHIAPIVDVMTPGSKGKSETQIAIEQWYWARMEE